MDFSDNGHAIYLQIADYILEKVLVKDWVPGEKVPSVRELAQNLGVNPNTVQRTYELLRQKEILYDKRGIGSFLAEDAFTKVKKYKTDEFREQELPRLFRIMQLLDISEADFLKDFQDYKKRTE